MQIPASTKKLFLLLAVIFSVFFISCKNSITPKVVLATDEYIHYTVNGTLYSFDFPADTIFANDSAETSNFVSTSTIDSRRIPDMLTEYARIGYQENGTTVGSSQNLLFFYTPQTGMYPYFTTSATPVSVNITEYGTIGQYISGNFTATLTSSGPGNPQYNVVCSFRVRRKI